MSDGAMGAYLNDHLGGATLGSELAAQIRDREEGTTRGDTMTRITAGIEEDRETLISVMDALDVSHNPVKQVTGWVAEKASRVKFSGVTSGEPDQGNLMALESLRLGVAGKKCLWLALQDVRDDYPPLSGFDLAQLIERASAQELVLEDERMTAAREALAAGSTD